MTSQSTQGDLTRSAKPKSWAVLCDFDDTAAQQNVAELLLTRFGDKGWQRLREKSRNHNLTFREYQEQAFMNIRASREEMVELVKQNASLRPHFRELVQFCKEHDIPIAILTLGLDFYVEALLQKEGLTGVDYYAVGTSFTPDGMAFIYKYTKPGCYAWGNCKCAVLERFREQGGNIIYVGDGRSDFCPATKADLVFAFSHLAVYCQQNGVRYTPFKDFKDVIYALQELTDHP